MAEKLIENTPAGVDFIFQGEASGTVAKRLLTNQMNPRALRTNATLQTDEWKQIDAAVNKAARQRLIGTSDLVNKGLTYDIPNGLGKSILQSDKMSDMSAADIAMMPEDRGAKDRVLFSTDLLPLPIIFKEFAISARTLQASRTSGDPLDVSQAEVAGRMVAEKIEEILFTGASTYTFGGGTVYGYTDFPSRNTVTLGTNWDASAATGEIIVSQVRDIKQAAINARHYGPYILYVPTTYETILDDDFKAASDKTIRQRIKEIGNIEDVKVADMLTANNVVLVSMTSDVVRMVIGMQPMTLEWETLGGMMLHFMVMAIMVPQIRADYNSRCGVVHCS